MTGCRNGRDAAHERLAELNAKPLPLSDEDIVERYQVKGQTFLCHYAATPCGWVSASRPCSCACHTGMAAHVGPCKCHPGMAGGLGNQYDQNVATLNRILGRDS